MIVRNILATYKVNGKSEKMVADLSTFSCIIYIYIYHQIRLTQLAQIL